jgi:hypothetical protein
VTRFGGNQQACSIWAQQTSRRESHDSLILGIFRSKINRKMRSKPPEYRAQNFSLQQINLFTLNSLRGNTSGGSNLGWNGIVRGVVFLANQAQSSCTAILDELHDYS